MEYIKAKTEVIMFDNEDVITTSQKECKNYGHETNGQGCISNSGETVAGEEEVTFLRFI